MTAPHANANGNPYYELGMEEGLEALHDQSTELSAEWSDICSRQHGVSMEAEINQRHRIMLSEATIAILGVKNVSQIRY